MGRGRNCAHLRASTSNRGFCYSRLVIARVSRFGTWCIRGIYDFDGLEVGLARSCGLRSFEFVRVPKTSDFQKLRDQGFWNISREPTVEPNFKAIFPLSVSGM